MPDAGAPDPATWRLRVDGLVEQPMEFSLDDLERLGRTSHSGEFTCVAGWAEGELRWEGTPLDAVLALVQPRDANAIYAYAPAYRALVPLATSHTAILSTRLQGERLSPERGAPCRLVVTHPSCELSMKWLERLELCASDKDEPPGPRKPPEG